MSFEEKLAALSQKAQDQREHLSTEESVKMAVISPLFHALEFDPFDPREVIPEYIADVGIKKGEKVDYAIAVNGDIGIIVECKAPNSKLDLNHASQLYRYFSVTSAKFAILTNGFDWQVYTDLDQPNRMDKRPFLSFELTDLDQTAISELSKFRKSVFNIEDILKTAENLKYVSALRNEFRNELTEPSDELVTLFARRVYAGRMTAGTLTQFGSLVKRSFSEVLRNRVNARLSSALQHNFKEPAAEPDEDVDEIETTEVEWDGFRTAVAIASKVIDPSRISIRDQKSYCGILVDDNNRKPLVRLWFNSSKTKYLGLFDGEIEEKVPVDGPVDLYKYAERIRSTAQRYQES